MCQMSIKLSGMFDQRLPHTFDKVVEKQKTTKTLKKLKPRFQGHSRKQKTMRDLIPV